VIRTAVFTAVLLAASPALAFGTFSAPAPKDVGNIAPFVHLSAVEHLAPAGVSEIPEFGRSRPAKDAMVVYDLTKGKPASHVDLTSPRDNPFMPQPERAPAPQH
jgi:hypothetical protein